jgi:hypothetical protein
MTGGGTAHLIVVNKPKKGLNDGVIRGNVGKLMLFDTPQL